MRDAVSKMEITDQSGNVYDMVSSLTTFMVNRKTKSFNFGDWLQSLTDNEIFRLQEIDYASDFPGNTSTVHLALIAQISLCVEQFQHEATVNQDTLLQLCTLVNLEFFRRQGWVILHSPLRLSEAEKTKFTISDEGLRVGAEMWKTVTKH